MLMMRVFSILLIQWTVTFTITDAFAMPKLPGLYSPELCLPMTDHSYPGDPDGDLSQEVIIANWNQETLFCKRGCCGDSKEAVCCLPEDEEGLTAFELISIVAAGIAGVTVITVVSLYFIKQHNKNKVLVHDINNINKMNGKGGSKAGKVDQYHKAPDFKNPQKDGQLFRKTNTPPDYKRPKSPISIVSPPDILPALKTGHSLKPNSFNNAPVAPLKHNLEKQLPDLNGPTRQPMKTTLQQQDTLIADLKAPSPPAVTASPSAPAPSPPLPENLPPPLIPSFKTADVDDDFIDSILASIPLEDPASTSYK